MNRKAMRAACSAIVLTMLGCGQDTTGPSPGPPALTDRHQLAFISDRDGTKDVYVIEADGANPVRITDDADVDYHFSPRWSPDGRHLAYLTQTVHDVSNHISYLTGDLFLLDAGGGSAVNVTRDSLMVEESVAWSADGTRLVLQATQYQVEQTGTVLRNTSIRIINPDGSEHFSFGCAARPALAPDGTTIAYAEIAPCAEPYVTGRLLVFDDMSNPIVPVVLEPPAGSRLLSARWGPGPVLLAILTTDGLDEIVAVDPAGAGVTNLTNHPAFYEDDFDVSPDGATILFAGSDSPAADAVNVFRMDADGSHLVQLTTAPGGNFSPKWSRDGTRIGFVSRRDDNAEIYVMNPDGSNQTNVTRNSAQDLDFDWR